MTTNGFNAEIQLSRDELALILQLLRAETIPGLDPPSEGALDEAQRDLANLVASRGLRARGLARLEEDGSFRLHPDLVTAVGVCAYPTASYFIYHWPPGREAPIRSFIHKRGGDLVAHTQPEAELHHFGLVGEEVALSDLILGYCALREAHESSSHQLRLSGERFVQLRSAARNGEPPPSGEDLDDPAAAALLETLAADYQATVLQALRQEENDRVVRQDMTLLEGAAVLWLIQPDEAENLSLRTVSPDEARAALQAFPAG